VIVSRRFGGCRPGSLEPVIWSKAASAQRSPVIWRRWLERIDAVAKVDGTTRVLDLTEATVRAAVASATDAAVLYRGDHASDY